MIPRDPAVDVIDTALLPSVQAANRHVDTLAVYPSFAHKWSKQRRAYTKPELRIPETLLLHGQRPNWDKPTIGVGGTRSPTVETFIFASNVCRMLAQRGAIIVSGGVPGVDLAAHLSAVDANDGSTLAVLANPPWEGLGGHEWANRLLEEAILKTGAFVSEYDTHAEVASDEFLERLLQRDRIITGLADVFVAFECNTDSATVDSAYRALAQGKKVIAIEPVTKTYRRGVQQLAATCPPGTLTLLTQETSSPQNISDRIMEIAAASPRHHHLVVG